MEKGTVQADAAIFVDIGMEHLGHEGHIGGLCGVILGELELQLENPARPGGALGSFDQCFPFEQVILLGGRIDPSIIRFFMNFLEVF